MGNIVRRWTGGVSEETIKSEYFSPRIERMMRSKSQFSSTVEHEIEHSQEHWSEVSDPSEFSEDNNNYEEVDRKNKEVFSKLMTDPQLKHHRWGEFFLKQPRWKLGQKIAEGGQAEIFEIMSMDGIVDSHILLKVFKRGSHLSDLQKQWPRGILRREVNCIVRHGIMLDDGRFAFGMSRCWGSLRKLIDQAMQEKNNQGPPFPYEWSGITLHAKDIMEYIAREMYNLHKQNIVHRDLKAANILLVKVGEGVLVTVADYECSIGVVGTGYFRAPEILKSTDDISKKPLEFFKKADVYSYAMTCFEILVGRLPFEGELEDSRTSLRDLVIDGRRPKLPSDLDVTLQGVMKRCWNKIPNERPSFSKILYELLFNLELP